jgi:hypothetical protein
VIETWLYTGDHIPSFAPKSDMSIIFEDESGKGDFTLGRQRWNVSDLVQKAINSSIVSPDMKEVPKYAQAQPAPKPVAQPAASAGLTSEALEAVVEEVKAGKGEYPKAAISYDEFVTPSGTHYVPVEIYVPKSVGLTVDSAVTFFGVVADAAGAVVTSYEEPAKLAATKNDSFFDKSLTLAPGKYTAVFGLAKDGKAVVVSSIAMDIAGREKDAVGISKLILSNNIYPLTVAQSPTDPYAFGGIKVVPKADLIFTTHDELWYFFELQNPGVGSVVKKTPVVKTETKQTSATTSESVSQVQEKVETEQRPKIQLKLDLEGTAGKDKVKMGSPLAEAPAEALKGVPGHYGVGSSIPLAGLKPGDYTLKIKVIDTVSKQTYNMEQGFKIIVEK